MNLQLIELTDQDFPFVKMVYDHYIIHSTVSFHTNPVAIDELKRMILIQHPRYKSYLIKQNNQNAGYCYLSQYRKKQAYDRTAEISIYLKPEFTRKGIGKKAMTLLERIAFKNGIRVLVGIITAENEASVILFEKCGFGKCAHYKQVGEKFNRILDVVAYQKILGA